MIHLYLIRHAKVDGDNSDATRTISEVGRKRFRKTARALSLECPKIELILTSPLVRAVQTAELLAAEVAHDALDVLPQLSPEHTAEELLEGVAARIKDARSVALIGHKPSLFIALARLANLWAGQRAHFGTGDVVRIDVSGLPDAKLSEPRWWLDSSSEKKHKGLPLKATRSVKKRSKAAAAKSARPSKSEEKRLQKRLDQLGDPDSPR